MNIKLPKEISDFIEANASRVDDIYVLPAYKKVSERVFEEIPLNKLTSKTWKDVIGTVYESSKEDPDTPKPGKKL